MLALLLVGLVIRGARVNAKSCKRAGKFMHCVPQPSPAGVVSAGHIKGQDRLHKAWAGHCCASHAGTLLLREEKEKKK